MSNNMYNTYDGCEFSYYTPSNFDHRTQDYLLCRYTPKAVWDYGDTPHIVFNLHECGLSVSDIRDIEGKNLKVQFYTNQFELIPFEEEIEAVEEFTVAIDYETSIKYFKRGTYYCSLSLATYNYTPKGDNIVGQAIVGSTKIENEEKSTVETYQTILPMFRCCFYVQ